MWKFTNSVGEGEGVGSDPVGCFFLPSFQVLNPCTFVSLGHRPSERQYAINVIIALIKSGPTESKCQMFFKDVLQCSGFLTLLEKACQEYRNYLFSMLIWLLANDPPPPHPFAAVTRA